MKCVVCKHGETQPGVTTVTLSCGNTTVVFTGVASQICDNCGEEYVDEAITAHLLVIADEAARARRTGRRARLYRGLKCCVGLWAGSHGALRECLPVGRGIS